MAEKEKRSDDIYELGFDRGLNRSKQDIDSPTVYNILDGAIDTGNIPSSGNLVLSTLDVAGLTRQVASGAELNDAIQALAKSGGGTVSLRAATFSITSTVNGRSSLTIEGTSPSVSQLDMMSGASLSFVGTDVYTTGTITAASGVSITGSGTSWLSEVAAGQHLFLGTRWYEIASVNTDTSLTLAESYGDNVTLPASYRIASVIQNITIRNLTLKNSSGTGLIITDARKVVLDNILLLDNNKGIVLTNCSEVSADRVILVSNTSNGIEAVNVGLSDWESVNAIGNGGSGFVLNNVKTISLHTCASNSNTADGFNVTTGSESVFLISAQGNGGQGLEFVSGNDNCSVYNGSFQSNGSDGIKLTATSDNIKIYGNEINANGGYGVNIAASSDDNTIVMANKFNANTTAPYNNSGTNSIIFGNAGATDSPAYQASDATLTALAAYNTNGLVTQTSADTFTGRTLIGPAAGITVSNGNGVSGNPTLALANDLSALEGLSSTGLAVRTGTSTWAQRTITAGTGITVMNGNGVSGNPTISSTTAVDRQQFDSSDTWTKPSSGTVAFIEGWGGGGSGASSNSHGGSGGGGGAYASRLISLSSLSSTVAVTIGTGGVAVSTGANGNAGGNTTFGSFLTAYGGGGGVICVNDANDFPVRGGSGGQGDSVGGNGSTTSLFTATTGQDSTTVVPLLTMLPYGLGVVAQVGADGVNSGAGGGASSTTAYSGGNTIRGGGGGGGAHNGGAEGSGGTSEWGGNGGQGQDDTTGTSGTAPGGGGGACSSGVSTSGAGADGRVIVTVW